MSIESDVREIVTRVVAKLPLIESDAAEVCDLFVQCLTTYGDDVRARRLFNLAFGIIKRARKVGLA